MKKIKNRKQLLQRYMSQSKKSLKRRAYIEKQTTHKNRALGRKNKKARRKWLEKKSYGNILRAPKQLCLLKNPDSVSRFLTRVEKTLDNGKSIFFELEDVTEIDYPTITALMAVLYRAKKLKREINGTFPLQQDSKLLFLESGFLYTLFNEAPTDEYRYKLGPHNQLFTLNDRNLTVASEIKTNVERFLWGGTETKLPALFTVIGELMDNTVSHASTESEGVEPWWVSVSYDQKNKRVRFTFIDYGVGVLKNLSNKKESHPVKKLFDKAVSKFGADASDEQLKSILEKSAAKVYKLKGGHGQGINSIYQAMKRGDLEELNVVANHAYGNASSGQYSRLKNEFHGTLYYWEICGNKSKK